MPRRKLSQWIVDQLPFRNALIVDDDCPLLALRITATAKSWVMRETSSSGKQTWSKLPGAFADTGKDKTTLLAARKEAKRLAKLGGAKEAKHAAKLEAEAEANKRARLCDVAPLWWAHNEDDWSVETKKSYTSYIKILEASALWKMPLRDMRKRHIDDWQLTVRKTRILANRALQRMRAIIKFALGREIIDRDPTAGCEYLTRKQRPSAPNTKTMSANKSFRHIRTAKTRHDSHRS